MFFIPPLKLFSFLYIKYLNFYPDFLVMQNNGMIKKAEVNLELMTSQNGKTNNSNKLIARLRSFLQTMLKINIWGNIPTKSTKIKDEKIAINK